MCFCISRPQARVRPGSTLRAALEWTGRVQARSTIPRHLAAGELPCRQRPESWPGGRSQPPVGPTPYDQVQREVQKTLGREGTVRRSRYGRGGRSGVARGRGPAGGAQSTDPRRSQFAPRRTGNPLPRGGPVTAPARGALLRRTPAAPSGEGRTPRGAEIPPRPAAPSCPSLLQRLAGSPSTYTYPTLATIHRAPLMARALPFWRRAPPPPFPASRRPRST